MAPCWPSAVTSVSSRLSSWWSAVFAGSTTFRSSWRSFGMHAGVEDAADGPGGPLEIGVVDAVVADLTAVGSGQPDHHPHGGRLPGAVRADESGDAPGRHVEGHVVDGEPF